MRNVSIIAKTLGSAILISTATSTIALAGGFDRGGVNIDQLFDNNRFSLDANVSYVFPNRSQLNVQRSINAAAAPIGAQAVIDSGISTTAQGVLGGSPLVAATTASILGVPAGAPAAATGLAILGASISPTALGTVAAGLGEAAQTAATNGDLATAGELGAAAGALFTPGTPPTGLAVDAGAAALGAIAAAGAVPDSDGSINGSVGFFVPRLGYKQNLGENLNCLFSYSEPFGADQNNGTGNALSASSVDFFLDTEDYGATCSYSFAGGTTDFGDSRISVIGGISYQELDGFLSRQSFLDFANAGIGNLQTSGIVDALTIGTAAANAVDPATVEILPTNTLGLGTFTVDGNAVGWRAGVAYEIPEIALRASIVYHSSYDYDLSGIQDNTGFGVDPTSDAATADINLTTEIPQALEVKLQSGIAEDTLAFFNFKWQDWSQLGIIPIVGGITATATAGGEALPTTLAFEPLYRDGYTVSGGIGRRLSEDWSALGSLTWDRGTATTVGSQSDSWTLSGGLNYTGSENFEIRVGGAVGLLTGGQSTGAGTTDAANAVFFEFDEDLLLAGSAGVRYKF